MNILRAHELFAQRLQREPGLWGRLLPPEYRPARQPCGCDPTPALLTGAALLSGALEDSGTFQDLCEAVEHFGHLLSAGIVQPEQWNDAGRQVIAAVIEWGEQQELAVAGQRPWEQN